MLSSCLCKRKRRSGSFLNSNGSPSLFDDVPLRRMIYKRFCISKCPQIADHFTMMLNEIDKLAILFSIGVILLYICSKTLKRSSLPVPPGPKKLPLLGNILDLPRNLQWLKFIEWGRQFSRFSVVHLHSEVIALTLAIDSNIIHIYAAGNNFVIVNSFDVAIELGDRRSAIYSSR